MRKLTLILFVLLVRISLPLFVSAQNQNLRFSHLSIESGLSQNSIFAILQDRQGLMWFGTKDGLNMYDGYKFTVYRNSLKDSFSLSNNNIKCLLEDKAGNLWIGTWGGGVNVLNRSTGKFSHYKFIEYNAAGLNNNFITDLLEDKHGNIWIGTDGGGLNKFEIKTKTFKHYVQQWGSSKSLSSNRINNIIEDRNGIIWCGTKGDGLNRLDPSTDKITIYEHDAKKVNSLSENWVSAIYEASNGDILVAGLTCINIFNKDDESFERYPIKNGPIPISAIAEDRNHTFWISTLGEGLFHFNKRLSLFTQYIHNPYENETLTLDNLPSIAIDRGGVIWIGSDGAGINKTNPHASKFGIYRNEPGNLKSIKSKSIRAIYIDKNQLLYIGGYGGVDVIDRKNELIMPLIAKRNNSVEVINSKGFHIFLEDANDPNIVWIGLEGEGISKYDVTTKKIKTFKNTKEYHPYGICGNSFYSGIDDGKGTIWLGSAQGLTKLDKASETFTCFTKEHDDPNSLNNNEVGALYLDNDGILWIGTTGGGLDEFDPKTEQFIHHVTIPNDTNSLSNNSIRSIFSDGNGILWIGTDGGGLNKYDVKKNIFKAYTVDDGLPNNVIYSILSDNKNNLWVSTNLGLSVFNPKTEKFKNFDISDGLQSNEFNQGAYYKGKNGELFFGGINGLNFFNPDIIKENRYPPTIIITSFKKSNTEFFFDKPINLLNEITLSHQDRVFSFEFSALDYTSPEKNQYAYKMEGFNEDWIYNGTNHEATFTNLNPGTYTFTVKGSNNDGVWNNKGTSIKIIIPPPFWQTVWFRVLIALLATAIVIAIFRIRLQNIKKQNLLLEMQVQERTHELSEINKQLEKLSIVASETANGVFITDANGEIEWFNEGFSKLFGYYSIEEYWKKRGHSIFEVSGNSNIREIVQKAISTKGSVIYENETPTSTGKLLWIKTALTPIFDETSELKKLVFVETDVTELKKAKETAEQALQIQEQFLANTSHEIRTPMNGVIGMTRQLLETPLNEEQVEYLNAIKESSNNLLHVVNDILDISKIRAGKVVFEKVEFRLSDIFKTLKFTLQYKVEEKNIYLKTDIEPSIPAVLMGDPVRLNQILLNIVGNAIKFTDNGGVTVSAKSNLLTDHRVNISFTVSDTGIGIPEDKLEYVFESFAQAETHTTRKYGGTGLGLSISKSLVEQQGGNISAESKLNSGTTFYFNLIFEIGDPNWQGPSFQSHETYTKQDLSHLKILLVEDNKINQKVAIFELKKWKITADVANEPMEAFEKLRTINYDLILMDISMPGMDGLEATKYIRKSFSEPTKNIPIIAMTASALSGEKEKCFEAGMNDYISKPFNPTTLYSKIIKWTKAGETITSDEEVRTKKKEKKKMYDLTQIREVASGDADYVKEILNIYIADMAIYLDDLNQYMKENKFQEIASGAHKMKSPAALLGVTKLKDCLIEIETEAQQQKEISKELVKRVNDLCLQSINELKLELAKIQTS